MTEVKDIPKPDDKATESSAAATIPAATPAANADPAPAPTTPAVVQATPSPAAETVATPASIPAPAPAPAPNVTPSPPTTNPGSGEETPRGAVTHPGVVALRSMFPDFDDLLLLSVLDSVGGNQDQAIDVLLGMSDPEYKSEPRPEEPVLTQTELDEQLARRLLLEDQEQQQAAWQASQQHAPHPGWQQRPAQGGRPAQSPGGDKDTMAEIGEQFNKFAETGKKTLGSLFSKVKQKVQEFDQGRQQNQGQSSNQQWGVGGDSYPYDAHTPPTHQQQQPAYYDPNAQRPVSTPQAPTTPVAPRGYDATPSPAIVPSSSPPTSVPGLLPKRPVSLLPTQSPEPAPTARKPSQDDELEYAENPFEDNKK